MLMYKVHVFFMLKLIADDMCMFVTRVYLCYRCGSGLIPLLALGLLMIVEVDSGGSDKNHKLMTALGLKKVIYNFNSHTAN